MSIQLILQPQNVQGFSSTIGFINGEMLVDGINFDGINSATGYSATSGNVIEEVCK